MVLPYIRFCKRRIYEIVVFPVLTFEEMLYVELVILFKMQHRCVVKLQRVYIFCKFGICVIPEDETSCRTFESRIQFFRYLCKIKFNHIILLPVYLLLPLHQYLHILTVRCSLDFLIIDFDSVVQIYVYA